MGDMQLAENWGEKAERERGRKGGGRERESINVCVIRIPE